MLVCCLFTLICLRSGWTADLPPIESVVDASKVQTHPLFSALVHHLFWPDSDLAGNRKLDRVRISGDVTNLSNLLTTRLTKDYLPHASIQTMADGILNYRDGSDYLFVRYNTKKNERVSIQDGRGLYVLIEPKERSPTTNRAQYVHDVAVSVLAYPEALVAPNNPSVFVSALDIGSSKVGRLCWGAKMQVSGDARVWYHVVDWWSDGTRVLFGISKLTEEDYSKLAGMADRSKHKEPRKLGYQGESKP